MDADPLGPDGAPATAIIAEDERALREELECHLTAEWPGLRIVGSVDNGIEALTLFERHRPTMMFLDIQMPGLTGLEVAQQVGEGCHVVFITAYEFHAVAAFQHGAVDYVLKPYEVGRLRQTVGRLRSRISTPPRSIAALLAEVAAATRPKPTLNWIKASHGAEVSLIPVRDVCYFRAEAKYTSVMTAEREFMIRRSIKELAGELDAGSFWQIHRSTIVNVEAIESVTRNLAGATVLKLKTRPDRLAVSEAYRHLFRHM